jgi:hypothetical protein
VVVAAPRGRAGREQKRISTDGKRFDFRGASNPEAGYDAITCDC